MRNSFKNNLFPFFTSFKIFLTNQKRLDKLCNEVSVFKNTALFILYAVFKEK